MSYRKLNKTIVEVFIAVAFLYAAVAFQDTHADCRNPAVKHQFDVQNGYPHGHRGFITDHICPLAQGGIDSTTNMQYQTIADSKIKDKVENTPYGKKKWCNKTNSTPTRQVFNCK